MQCSVCHNAVPAQSAFCPHCGASLAAASTPTPASGFTEVPPAPGYTDVPPAYTAPPSSYQPPPPGYPPPPPNYSPPGYPPPGYPPPGPVSAGLPPNQAAAIAYITIIPAIIFLVMEPYNRIPLVRFHAWQSIGLCVVGFALQVVLSALTFAAFFLFHFLHFLLFLGLFIVWLVTILKASKGEWYKLPVIGDFAMKQAQS